MNTMQYFWHYDADIPAGLGVKNFSPAHFGWLAVSLAFIAAMVFIYRRMSAPARIRLIKGFAVSLVLLELSRTIWAISVGPYVASRMLPLHLCGVMIFIELAAVFTGKGFLKEFAYCTGLPGALMAILTPEPSGYPLISFQYLQSIAVHTTLVLIPVLWLAGDGFRPDIRNLPKCFAVLLGLTGINAVVNTLLHSNYMFICRAPADTPLAVFDRWVGHPWYIGPVLACVVIVWTILYLPWALTGSRKARCTPKASA